MKRRLLLASVLLAALFLLTEPAHAYAWGPATHIYLGLEVLRSLDLFPSPVAGLLATYPFRFLYGSLAPDISLGKKYAPLGRHCHDWRVALEAQRDAGQDPVLRATALGYLCHLAADVVAHEEFVPRMLLLTSSTRSVGHSYWEHRMDTSVDSAYMTVAHRLVSDCDHETADRFLEDVLTRTIFSFQTNRRIFRGIIRLGNDDRWQAIFDTLVENSRWELREEEVDVYLRHSFRMVTDFLVSGTASEPVSRSPIGETQIRDAKRIRRQILRSDATGAAGRLLEAADARFPLPLLELQRWSERGTTPAIPTRVTRRLGIPLELEAAPEE